MKNELIGMLLLLFVVTSPAYSAYDSGHRDSAVSRQAPHEVIVQSPVLVRRHKVDNRVHCYQSKFSKRMNCKRHNFVERSRVHIHTGR